jgi:hypothetical protein
MKNLKHTSYTHSTNFSSENNNFLSLLSLPKLQALIVEKKDIFAL